MKPPRAALSNLTRLFYMLTLFHTLTLKRNFQCRSALSYIKKSIDDNDDMIRTKEDLKYYLTEDAKRYNPSRFNWLYRMMGFESATVWHIQRRFRLFEYARNNRSSLLGRIRYVYYYFRYQRLSIKYGVHLNPNIIGPGLRIVHIGGGILTNCNSIGENCTIQTGVSLGNSHSEIARPTIGDNVSLGIGCKIFGDIRIGNNVFVAPGAVVTKDVPDNAIVGGVPAKIIKIKK